MSKKARNKKIERFGGGDLSEEDRMAIVSEAVRMLDREEALDIRAKIATAKKAANEGRVVSHKKVKRRFIG